MRTGNDVQEAWPTAALGLAGGCATVVVAALVTAGAVPPGQATARVLAMAATVGVLAVVLTDWRACAGVTLLAALIFVGFLVHREGDLTGDPSAWPYTIIIVLAALLGRGVHWLRRAPVDEPSPSVPR